MVSVIIPFHKKSNLLLQTLNHLKNVSYVGEVLLVNDYTSWDLHQELSQINLITKINFSIRILNNSFLKGVSGCRNTGILEARCEFLVFLDYDDYFLPNRFNFLSETWNVNNNVNLFISNYKTINIFTSKSINNLEFNFNKKKYSPGINFFEEYNFNIPHLSCFLFKRINLIESGLKFNENLTGSEDTVFKLYSIYHFGFLYLLNSFSTVITRHNDNTTNNIYAAHLIDNRIKAYKNLSPLMNLSFCLYRHQTKGLLKNLKRIVHSYEFILSLKLICNLFIVWLYVNVKFKFALLFNKIYIKIS